jgi:hypothetical protein
MRAELAELNSIVAELPPELVRKVIEYARGLTSAPPGHLEIGEWTEEELREEAIRALRRFDE